MLMSDAVSKLAAKTPGKEAVAMEAFAKALRMVTKNFNFCTKKWTGWMRLALCLPVLSYTF